MAKITFEDKAALNPQPSVAEKNKVTDTDMNEIKSSVNALYDYNVPEVIDLSTITTLHTFINNANFTSSIIKLGKLVVINVYMTLNSWDGTNEVNAMYLPAELRPITSATFVCQAYLYGGWNLSTNDILGRVNTDGYVKVRPASNVSGDAKTISISVCYITN